MTYKENIEDGHEELLKAIVDELKYSEINGLWKPNYKEGYNDGIAKAVEIISKHLGK